MVKVVNVKKIIFIYISGLLVVTLFLLSNSEQEMASCQVVAVCLWAENVPETSEFYQTLLGATDPPVRQEGRIRLKLGGAVLFILEGKPCSAESDISFPLFALTVKDLDKAEAFLKKRNINMPYGIEGSSQHRELQFYDPAGNLVELVQDR